jgi:hypothetical protein
MVGLLERISITYRNSGDCRRRELVDNCPLYSLSRLASGGMSIGYAGHSCHEYDESVDSVPDDVYVRL